MLSDSAQLPTLTGEQVRLRWLTDQDVESLFDIFSHEDVVRYWSQPAMSGLDEAKALLQTVNQCFEQRSLFQWGIERLDTDGVIGTCTLAALDPGNRRADLGFALHRRHWGNGFVSDALRTVLRFAFETLNMHRIEADVDPRNDRSIRVLERQGFQREGFLRERWIVNGQIADTLFFGLLRREWTGPPPGTRAS